ncbi:hypothetical protein GCM10010406_22250 [Streptomyces thermolineatus]|uniref:DUF7691 domain-containing protein n=1 Tax=Streptomyces thermolineatus TaxID=44033 RepID=A0ABN3LJS0_9ACTN
MSHVISMKTVDLDRTLSYVRGGELTDRQEQVLDTARERARAAQHSLDHQGVDRGLTVPEALEHLVSGRADATGDCAGNAYYAALLAVIECTGSDAVDVGVYSKPSTFFGLMGDELRSLGVPSDMLPHKFLYADLPGLLPYRVPTPMDGYPAIGHLPLNRAKAVADAYTAVLPRLGDEFTYDTEHLVDLLTVEHEEWQASQKYGHTADTIVFWIQG